MNIEFVPHMPVMEAEVVEFLRLQRHDVIFVDCTIGYGGHSNAVTQTFNRQDRLIGIDRDEEAIAYCRNRFANAEFQVRFHRIGFDDLDQVFEEEGIEAADAFLFDCGFSSPQIERPERGFSFLRDGPLDMRMDQRQRISARELIHSWSEQELGEMFKNYGEERFARKIAKSIVRRRQESPIETTQELADIVISAIPMRYRHQEGIHPATRVFQAIRIMVNNELDVLRVGLQKALDRLRPGGRIAALSYHSLEHRIIKERFREFCGRCICPPGLPQCGCGARAQGSIITKKPMKPCAAELERNIRCRSAQLRVLERFWQSP
ncbi:MAG: 16S rRNA (cytosine(1402)-N(4))-methyltransferase RsmH [Candidatus Omnitrophota bacterium]|jgi:16S rRNA (cytosine1402-N4)-methyltransferase|nr:MAG: 16S rRNA (cytosine(1402)-N(4))-methyltransferase RsmH [Candidatus Omnitrophota bacterium]